MNASLKKVEQVSPTLGKTLTAPLGLTLSTAGPDVSPSPGARRRRAWPLILGCVALAGVISIGFFWKRLPTFNRAAENAASIVVLPFIDLTAEKADQAFCD